MLKETIDKLPYVKRMRAMYARHERAMVPAVLLFGFIFDIFTFKSIDVNTAFLLLGVHLVIVMLSILFVNFCDIRWKDSTSNILNKLRLFSILLMQFSFGALLSAAFIFYSFGGSISGSWPLIVLLLFMMIANEVFKQFYLKTVVQVSVLFLVLFVFLSIVFPFVFHSISLWFFVLAGVTSLAIISLYVFALYKLFPILKQKEFYFYFNIILIFTLLNGLYFLNFVPPIPVSMVDAGMYQGLKRIPGGYDLVQQKENIFEKIVPGKKLKIVEGEPIYAFTSVFAPSKLQTKVVHNWQWQDDKTKEWKTINKLSYNINGGRKKGYRGYSLITKAREGSWRVLVETERSQVFGKIKFDVEFVDKITKREHIKK